ncbi:dTDP-4-dehydrorhamnose reductase [Micromonospora craniellae]|uniref:dTDP-4-dehydrorhamnose reductase n=1 Tax=Micromonospora craniellae TaxID=2294034 RepID=A0A372G0R4_9ACTN|nr:dTDP-4-dehydrorhamnose reductase [Micromonospora craniellae]RFS46632.1 dTDP-4-dehydrorhamnose reductase [Micromonospora craniellae]
MTGAGGMLGRDLVEVLATAHTVTPATRADLDVTDAAAVHAAVAGHDVVVNAAAWTDVDGAESDEAAATRVNGEAVAHLATACAAHGARLIQLSTDYVFPGDAATPYREDTPTAPINAYGRSKLAGELAVTRLLPDAGYVVRTAWLYGAHGRNFVSTMLGLASQREFLDVVDDQRGQPTWSYALARQVRALAGAALAGRAAPGVYHGTCAGETTWYGLARAAFVLHGLDPDRIRPITSNRFPRLAARPAYSVLGHDRWAAAGLSPLPDWHAALSDALALAAPPSPWKVA